MARAERDALDALGLDSGRATFRLDADRLREHVEAVRGPVAELTDALSAVSDRLDEVEGSALASVEVANRGAAEAEAARVEAQQARERAERETREARDRAA
ncbi:MAG: response regulator receiver, partial [Pseudonocardia sp.]|nr:response regulator receiver [Pseudonocardia sp.]